MDNMALLSDWRAKAMSIYSNESPKNIVAVSSVLSKKATTIWQDEFFWIAGSLSNLKDREIWSYTGCDSCGKKTSGELGVRFDCHACSAKNVSIELKLVLTTDISDHEATLKATIYSSVAEKMLGLSAAEFVALRKKGESTVEAKLQEVRQMKFLIKICPNHELTISNVLKWIVNSIEVVPPEFESDIRKTPMKGMAVATTECDAGLVDRQSKTGYSPAAGENFHTPVTSPTSVDHLGLCGLDVTVTPLASNPLVKDNTVTKQPVSPGGRPSNRKSRALRINMNNNSYAGIEDNESEASGMNASVSGLFENTALAGESQLDEE